MERFVINLTNRCNFTCKTCLRGGATAEDLDLNDLRQFLSQAKEFGFCRTSLTGGEPILHPHFDQVVKELAEHNISFGMVSNGWLYRRYAKMLEPYRKHVRFIAISLDGHTAALNDANRKKGSFDRVFEAIQFLKKEGYSVRISHIVNQDNIDGLHDMVQLAKSVKVAMINIGRVISCPTNKETRVPDRELYKLRLILRMLISANPGFIHVTTSAGLRSDFLFCSNFMNMGDLTLRYDGIISFCCDSLESCPGAVLGNIREQQLSAILPAFGKRLGTILTARIASMTTGRATQDNDCDFCNRMLNKADVEFGEVLK